MLAISQLISVLQTAIGPVILVSGIGLLLLTMTNRLGRAIDRARSLSKGLAKVPEEGRARKEAQLRILWGRARLIRLAIALASTSALSACLLVIALFVTALLQIEVSWLISFLFILCMLLLSGSILAFIRDINRSLAAVKLEIGIESQTPAANESVRQPGGVVTGRPATSRRTAHLP